MILHLACGKVGHRQTLMDVMMPVMDGYEACAAIRAEDHEQGTPIIMLTGAEDLEAIDRAFNAGATDFITKPINWPLLTQRVRYALRSGELAREVRHNRLREAAAQRLAQLGFWSWKPSDNSLVFSEDIKERLELLPSDIPHLQALLDLCHREDRDRVRRGFEILAQGGQRIDLEARIYSQGQERILRLIGEREKLGTDSEHVFGAFQNVTDTRRTEALLNYLAMHDELTGLANRRLFIRKASETIEEIARDPKTLMVIGWIDLTRFHRHNDALGEEGGNALLSMVAQRLRMLEISGGEVARVGGDEFAVMIRVQNMEEARHRIEHLLESLDYPFKIQDQEMFLSCTVGLAIYPDHGIEAEALLKLAQEAQRQARLQGKRQLEADQIETRSAVAVLDIERALRRALDNDEFYLVYQPQMNLRTGRIVGVEALLRWRHPERGLVSPVEFIPVLEEMGLISQVGIWVLKKACLQAKAWSVAGMPLRVGVNLSARQFLDPDLFGCINLAREEAGVSPELIELEITESLAMQDPDHAIKLLQNLRELGHKVAIDDFGIGYSSLEYLLRFPVDTIKIDRAFVSQITHQPADRAIVRAITAIAETLGHTTIAEGVETLRQCDFIEALGVSEIQGYLIGKPMGVEEINHLARYFVRPGETPLGRDA
jgi:diguanylate cyclase (GGDEF)-like protein